MHRQGVTEEFDSCPICKDRVKECRQVDVREGVWFTCCPACFTGMRLFFQQTPASSRHPALGGGRGRWAKGHKGR